MTQRYVVKPGDVVSIERPDEVDLAGDVVRGRRERGTDARPVGGAVRPGAVPVI